MRSDSDTDDEDDDKASYIEVGDQDTSDAYGLVLNHWTAINNRSDCNYCVDQNHVLIYYQSSSNDHSRKTNYIHRNFGVPKRYRLKTGLTRIPFQNRIRFLC